MLGSSQTLLQDSAVNGISDPAVMLDGRLPADKFHWTGMACPGSVGRGSAGVEETRGLAAQQHHRRSDSAWPGSCGLGAGDPPSPRADAAG